MVGKLTGNFTRWTLCDKNRLYGTIQNLPYCEARMYIKAVRFNGQTGTGQQRDIVDTHVRRLKKEMAAGNFTPTNVSAACSNKHQKALVLNDGGTFVLEVSSDAPLLHTDGGHRFEALNRLIKELEEKSQKAEGEEKERLSRWLEQARNVPVTVTVYFDGDPAWDFIRLQQGRAVDTTHLLSLKVYQKVLGDPAVQTGFQVAKLLHKQEGSPIHHQVRFDSRGDLPLPVSTVCSKGASDIGTSLVGLARVGLMGEKVKEPDWLAGVVTAAFKALQKDAPSLLADSKVLTPLSEGGTKGSTTMLIGLGVVLAYRLSVLGREAPTEDDLSHLVESAEFALDDTVCGNFSGPTKRRLLGVFAKDFLADLPGEKHEGLPVGLLRTLSPSAFGVGPLPKEKKQKGERRASAAERTSEDAGDPANFSTEGATATAVAAVA
jgi:hypothetical protein